MNTIDVVGLVASGRSYTSAEQQAIRDWIAAEDALADATPAPRYREDGYRLPEDGEEYDPEAHGPVPYPQPGH